MLSIRLALLDDVDSIAHLDRTGENRRAFIIRSVGAGACSVIVDHEKVIGYAVMDYSFFEHGFISMLYVKIDCRRHGAGLQLVQHLECICKTKKIFTSTNFSNLPMKSLLTKSGYTLSGVIHHLDEGDPELIYVKYPNRDQ